MPRSGVQRAIKSIVRSCNIHKAITPHSLRHCYGTHLLEAGVSLRALQHKMGNESPNTTALYTQLEPSRSRQRQGTHQRARRWPVAEP